MPTTLLVAAASVAISQAPFAIAGVQLGMTVEQVRIVLVAHGYSGIRVGLTDSFRQRLSDAVAVQLSRRVTGHDQDIGILTASSSGQNVSVAFDDDERGNRVVGRVQYSAPSLAFPITAVGPELVRRFGKPTKMEPYGAAWCSDSKQDSCDVGGLGASDQLTVRAESDFKKGVTSIDLDTGKDITQRRSNAFRKRVRDLIASPSAF